MNRLGFFQAPVRDRMWIKAPTRRLLRPILPRPPSWKAGSPMGPFSSSAAEVESQLAVNWGDMSKSYSTPPPITVDTNKTYSATFVTSRGSIVCELFAKDAPNTVNNFVFLAREGFYDGTVFHRVIGDFMIQGGDPTGTGRGGPGYKFEDELKTNPRRHSAGTLSMANAGPNTNGSQFFITHVATPHLDGKHTVFGQVLQGQDVVNAVQQGDTISTIQIEEK